MQYTLPVPRLSEASKEGQGHATNQPWVLTANLCFRIREAGPAHSTDEQARRGQTCEVECLSP